MEKFINLFTNQRYNYLIFLTKNIAFYRMLLIFMVKLLTLKFDRMATGKITIHIQQGGQTQVAAEKFTIDFNTYRPGDVIQLVYLNGANAPAGGGTTIWKMGRCITPAGNPNPLPGALLAECQFFSDPVNGLTAACEVFLVEKVLPHVI
ncbi:MAG: hypothetical protein NTY96_01895 [Bacteroidetes bacterium]|nr:hypothetical protein [Bacteroidota bacterium]